MKFCCGITLYHPTSKELEKIEYYKKVFEKIYIYDNTDSHQNNAKKLDLVNQNIEYISNNINEGLSIAFNNMCDKAISDGFDYICLFDQDSTMLKEDILSLKQYIVRQNNDEIGIYTPTIIYQNESKFSYSKDDQIMQKDVDWAISSGSFINLNIYNKNIRFDENYFIDRLDYDYCMMLRRNGYRIVQLNKIFLYQSLGELKNGYIQHSPIRHYYMARNRLYFNKKFYDFPKCLILSLGQTVHHIFLIVRFEDNKFKKLNSLLTGILDFLKRVKGKKGDS